jgi:phage tail sheath protein FI
MPTYSTPGVYVTEGPLANIAPTVSGGTAAVFFGAAERGPTAATLVTDWNSYKRTFGDLKNEYDLGYAVYHFFGNGGRACYVVRVVGTDGTTPDTAEYLDVPYYPTGSGNASAALFDVAAISDGTWGNNISVQIEALTDEGGSAVSGLSETTNSAYGTFTLVIKLSGTEVERWPAVTIDPNGNRYVQTVINTYSKYITISGVSTEDASEDVEYIVTSFALTGGAEGTLVAQDIADAADRIDTISGNLLLNAVGDSSSTANTALVNKASTRGDSMVIIDPSITAETISDLQTTGTNFADYGGYAAHYAPALKMVDPSKSGPGAIRDTYPGGAIAGLMVRTEVQRSVAKAPAGYSAEIRGALGLTVPLSNDDIGTLYDGNPYINSFKAIPGAGIAVFGARTLERTASDKYIPVRRTLNYLKTSLKQLTQFAVFEPNDENLWSRITATVSGFLSEFYNEGGLKGTNASQAFFVICDSTNNTATNIDQGIVNIEVGVALQNPAEYIVINLSQWSGGSNTVETL